jgi:hypothetical protein
MLPSRRGSRCSARSSVVTVTSLTRRGQPICRAVGSRLANGTRSGPGRKGTGGSPPTPSARANSRRARDWRALINSTRRPPTTWRLRISLPQPLRREFRSNNPSSRRTPHWLSGHVYHGDPERRAGSRHGLVSRGVHFVESGTHRQPFRAGDQRGRLDIDLGRPRPAAVPGTRPELRLATHLRRALSRQRLASRAR